MRHRGHVQVFSVLWVKTTTKGLLEGCLTFKTPAPSDIVIKERERGGTLRGSSAVVTSGRTAHDADGAQTTWHRLRGSLLTQREKVCVREENVLEKEREKEGGGLQERCVLLLLLIQACSGTEVLTQHRL